MTGPRRIDQVKPLKQRRAGDELEPVNEWCKQFEGSVLFNVRVVDDFVDNTDETIVRHGLGRRVVGAFVVGVLEDFTVTVGNEFAYLVALDESDENSFRAVFQKNISGTLRWLVF